MDERLLVKGQSAGIPQRLPVYGTIYRGCISLRYIRLEIHRMRRMWSVPL